jgi:ubiquinone biosynthesis protein
VPPEPASTSGALLNVGPRRPGRHARRGGVLGRLRDVATVLAAHGLADVVDALHLGRYVAWGTRMLPGRARIDPSLSRAARFRLTLEELGPTFVKFGQALSVRADVLPTELVAELSRLQDQAAPLGAGAAEAVVEAELGEPVARLFSDFDPVPFAAASIAQAHNARLPTGEPVVIKVRRPNIARTIATDIEILRQLARLAERYVPAADVVGPVDLVEEFARTIRAEQDFVREARNVERCATNFAGDPTVRLPRVVWERTAPGVLTLERLDGLKVSELGEAGVDASGRRLVAQRGADAMLAQILVHGFFHADPHPGNILVLPDYVIGFLDFGIVGRLDPELRDQIARVVRAVWRRDAEELAALAIEIAAPRADVDAAALERDLADLVETYADVPIGRLSMSDVLRDVLSTAARHRLRMPSNLMLLVKAVVTIEGVGRQLDPSFRMAEHAAPLADRLWRERYAPDAVGRRWLDASVGAARALRSMPRQLEAIARKLRQGRLEVQFVHRNLDFFVREMDRSSNRIALALVVSALIIGSSLVVGSAATAGIPRLGLVGFVIAGLFGIGLAIGILRSGRL